MRSAILQTQRVATRLLIAALILLPSGVVSAACSTGGGDAAGPGGGSLIPAKSADQQKAEYMQSFGAMQAALEDPSAPPTDTAIKQGNKTALISSSQRWDGAIAALSSITPPADIKIPHEQLIAAMKELSKANFAMASAAPNARRVQAIYKKALNSAASKAYGDALQKIQDAGYPVLDQPSTSAGTADPLGSAGAAGG